MSSIGRERSGRGKDKQGKKMLWPLVSLLLSLPLTRSQSTPSSLSLNTPLSLSGNNFSSSAPLLFSLPSSSQLTISIALCASPSSSPPRVFVSNSSDSQVPPGPNGGPDVFEVTLNSIGLGNLTLDAGDTTGVLAVYGGTTSDSLEIGVSQGGKATNLPCPSPPTELISHDRQHPSTSPSYAYPTSATPLRTKLSFSPHPFSHPHPRSSQHTRTIPSRQLTRRSRHSRLRPNPRHSPTLPSSSPRSTPDFPRSRRRHVLSAHA